MCNSCGKHFKIKNSSLCIRCFVKLLKENNLLFEGIHADFDTCGTDMPIFHVLESVNKGLNEIESRDKRIYFLNYLIGFLEEMDKNV